MKIVRGRGRNRKLVIDFPDASLVNSASPKEQFDALTVLCGILNVPIPEDFNEQILLPQT